MNSSFLKKNGVSMLLPFLLVTFCFALWGFANDITNPMVKAFSKIFRMSVTDGALVQVAFYGGYFAMAFPAALFVKRFSYKAGILLGLGLYAVGTLSFFPAKSVGSYYAFLGAYFVMTCGLSFLETSANPFVLTLGSSKTATLRINLAQAFNPIGSLVGMYVAMRFIQERLCPLTTAERRALPTDVFEQVKNSDLTVLIAPYLAIGVVILVLMALIAFLRMPSDEEKEKEGSTHVSDDFRKLIHSPRYYEGVVAQFFYVGAQIMCWTFIIQYGTRIFMLQGMDEQAAEVVSQQYNMVAMVFFCISRFVCTFLLRFFKPASMLAFFSLLAIVLVCGVIFLPGIEGLYCLVLVSACMSLMFPTIYGIALGGLGEEAKLGAAGQIMAILGGSVLPPVQASIIDMGICFGMSAVNVSFILPLVCFVMILWYSIRCLLHKV